MQSAVFPHNANVFVSFLFCAILIFIDLTKKCVGDILKKVEEPDHRVISTVYE